MSGLDTKQQTRSLNKGSTFHASKSPSSPAHDPILNVRGVPVRSPTSPQSLEVLVTEYQALRASTDKEYDTWLSEHNSTDSKELEALPLPRFLLEHASLDQAKNKRKGASKYDNASAGLVEPPQNNHGHLSDSGLGSSIASESDDEDNTHIQLLGKEPQPEQGGTGTYFTNLADKSSMGNTSVYSPTKPAPLDSSVASGDVGDERPFMSTFATEKVKQYIVEPLLAEDKVKDFHSLVSSIPSRISARKITCLRDLEKTLIFCAPVSHDALALTELGLAKQFLVIARQTSAKSAASYLQFCETSIQCIHTTVEHVNELDKQRPSDRPYSNNYFLDLISQVRQYAGIMASSRAKQAAGKAMSSTDYTTYVHGMPLRKPLFPWLTPRSDEKVVLDGGEGKPARLVRVKDGKEIPIEVDEIELAGSEADDETERSMARKRKCDIGKEVWHACRECGKQFTRPCDLTKHEKTHSRPWKCPVENCKYHLLGWPTEKECDRHFNDKHTSTPSLYQCLYEGCTYTSKRESNCKQHMEKTHGYEYVRSKSKKAARLVPSGKAGEEPTAMLTPNSALNSIPTPGSSNFMSPQLTNVNELSPPATDEAPSPFGGDMQTMSLFGNNNSDFLAGQGAANNFSPVSYTTTPNEVVTPALTFSDLDPTIPDDAWNLRFDFDDIANSDESFPSPEEFFQQYSTGKQDPIQQPTPEMSDFDLSKDMSHQFGTMDARAMGSMTATAQQQNPMLNSGTPSLGGANALSGDFSLFADNTSQQTNTFSDLAGNGGQFFGDRKPRTVWDEWYDA